MSIIFSISVLVCGFAGLGTGPAQAASTGTEPALAGAGRGHVVDNPSHTPVRTDRRRRLVVAVVIPRPVVAAGDDVIVRAVVRPPSPGRAVRWQMRRDGHWSALGRGRQNRRGAVKLRVRHPETGSFSVRAVTRGPGHRSARSSLVAARVAPREEIIAVDDQTSSSPTSYLQKVDLSANGRTVAYRATTTVDSDGDREGRAFVFDRLTGRTSVVVPPSGAGGAGAVSLSATGRYVATVNYRPQHQSSSQKRVLVTDLADGRVSRLPLPTVGDIAGVDLSGDGQHVAVTSSHTGADCGERPRFGLNDVAVFDRSSGRVRCLTRDFHFGANDESSAPLVSSDGSIVSFLHSWQLEANGEWYSALVVWRRGEGRQVVRSSTNQLTNEISDDGRRAVVYVARPGTGYDIGIYDLRTGATRILPPVDDDAIPYGAVLSGDGNVVFYLSWVDDGTPSEPDRQYCLFRQAVATGATERISCDIGTDTLSTTYDGTVIASLDNLRLSLPVYALAR